MAKKPKSDATSKAIENPIVAKHALEEFGVSWSWLRPRLNRGEIRSKKVGNRLILDRSDVARLAPDQEDRELLERALKDRKARKRGGK